MTKKERVLFVVILAVLFFAVFWAGTAVDARSKPDIIMTPSYTDYLTFECYGGAAGVVVDYDEGSIKSGELRCLPIRPE